MSTPTELPPAPTRRAGPDLLDVTEAWTARRVIDRAAKQELSPELLKAGVARLGGAAAANTVLTVLPVLLMLIATPVDSPLRDDALVTGYAATLLSGTVLSAGMFGLTRLKLTPQTLIGFGNAYLILFALILGLFRHSHAWPATEGLRDWSPVALWVLAYAALVPTPPRAMLVLALTAASMDPLAMFLMKAVSPPPPTHQAILLEASPFVGAIIGYVVSRVVHQLNSDIVRAREIGSYKLVKQLGVGGMAEVWLARHRLLVRPAAVKLIRPNVLVGGGPAEAHRLARLFEKEAQTTAGLQSPHTIQIYDFGVTREGSFYYVMELLDGYDLQTIVDKFGRLPQERVAHISQQVCFSLYEAHANDFVHRDVKPSNIFTCCYAHEFDFAKVLDFGLVKDQRPTEEEINEERLVGTPAVMAPEMLRFDAKVDARADIYSLGCVMYWMLVGERVFEAETRNDMLVMHAHQRPAAPSKRLGEDIHPDLEAVILDCLHKNPNKRPESAREVADRLAAIEFDEVWSRDRAKAWWAEHGTGDGPATN